MKVTRREATRRILGLTALGLPTLIPRTAWGANEQIRVGVIGLAGRGLGAHIPGFQNQTKVEVVAVSDPDPARLAQAVNWFQNRYGRTVDAYPDMRRLLDRNDIDCIANATQNYWHGVSTIWACRAGKHVYVEKPLSHYIWEGRKMLEVARACKRIVQVGTQRRSQTSIRQMIDWLRQGHLGAIRYVLAFANKPRKSCGKRTTPLPLPPGLDYDLWCGPAPVLPVYRDRLQYDCSFDWITGDGESCNQGVHEVDVARWCLGETGLPRRVLSIGGRFVFNDACNTPNTQIIYYEYPSAPILYLVHNLPESKGSDRMPTVRGEAVGVIAECEGGWASLYRGVAFDREGREVVRFSGNEDHFANFIEAVRTQDPAKLTADIEEGHISTAVCHLGNISYRVGRRAPVAEQQAAIAALPYFGELHDRLMAHLAAHEVDPNTAILGEFLEVDTERECVVNHPAANRIVRGWYRKPYVTPELET